MRLWIERETLDKIMDCGLVVCLVLHGIRLLSGHGTHISSFLCGFTAAQLIYRWLIAKGYTCCSRETDEG